MMLSFLKTSWSPEAHLFADAPSFCACSKEFKRATALNPNYATAHNGYSILLGLLGRPDESIAEIRKAVEVDPLSIPVRNMLAGRLATYNRCDESLEEDRRTLVLDPSATHLSMARQNGEVLSCQGRGERLC